MGHSQTRPYFSAAVRCEIVSAGLGRPRAHAARNESRVGCRFDRLRCRRASALRWRSSLFPQLCPRPTPMGWVVGPLLVHCRSQLGITFKWRLSRQSCGCRRPMVRSNASDAGVALPLPLPLSLPLPPSLPPIPFLLFLAIPRSDCRDFSLQVRQLDSRLTRRCKRSCSSPTSACVR